LKANVVLSGLYGADVPKYGEWIGPHIIFVCRPFVKDEDIEVEFRHGGGPSGWEKPEIRIELPGDIGAEAATGFYHLLANMSGFSNVEIAMSAQS